MFQIGWNLKWKGSKWEVWESTVVPVYQKSMTELEIAQVYT